VNREKLRRHLSALEALAAALRADLESLPPADPLASHIFQARHRCRVTEKSDGKGGKRVERYEQMSLNEARRLGFQGGMVEWRGDPVGGAALKRFLSLGKELLRRQESSEDQLRGNTWAPGSYLRS
jgi:hypothetical protein